MNESPLRRPRTPSSPCLLCAAVWVALIVLAWRRGRRVEAYGLTFVGIAYLPVANLLFPQGVVVAERFLYLPSAGLAIALRTWVARLQPPLFGAATARAVLAGGIRSAPRFPVWRAQRRPSVRPSG